MRSGDTSYGVYPSIGNGLGVLPRTEPLGISVKLFEGIGVGAAGRLSRSSRGDGGRLLLVPKAALLGGLSGKAGASALAGGRFAKLPNKPGLLGVGCRLASDANKPTAGSVSGAGAGGVDQNRP